MAIRLWERIEDIRQKPEAVRMRYLIGCLAVSMAFIVALWLLSLNESFSHVSGDVPKAIEAGSVVLPQAGNGIPSLQDLKDQAQPLTVDGTSQGADTYFDQQFQERSGGLSGEGAGQ